jgi:outer membrane immunogenic protein
MSHGGAARAADKFEEISMKRILGGMVVAAALSGSAFATDLPLPRYTKAPAIAAPAYNWSGWYGGLNAGWVGGAGSVSNDASIVSNVNPPIAEAMAGGATNTAGASSGFIGGGQFGYNYQFSGSFVAGFEADIQGLTGTHKRSSSAALFAVPGFEGPFHASIVTNSTTTRDLSYLGTLRARIGVLVAPSFLLYATGGLAYGGAKSDTTIAQSVTITNTDTNTDPLPSTLTSGSFSRTRVGYAVGAGGEWMLSSNWSAKLEYLYYDLGSATYTTGGIANDPKGLPDDGTAAVATSSKVRFNDNIVRVGVNYHFGSPAVSQY